MIQHSFTRVLTITRHPSTPKRTPTLGVSSYATGHH